MKKTLYTLNIGNYEPEITAITYPWMKKYAERIGAEFYEITERKFPDMPICYEKLQIKELAKERGDDWAIYFDGDALIHPETIDFTNFLKKDTVLHNAKDMANIRWDYDEYLRRDGRNIGSCNWFAIASDWCLDLWTPSELSLEEMLKNIHPTVMEQQAKITKEHLLDDYTVSRNIAKFGLKFKSAIEILEELGTPQAYFFEHRYLLTPAEKIKHLKGIIKQWGLE